MIPQIESKSKGQNYFFQEKIKNYIQKSMDKPVEIWYTFCRGEKTGEIDSSDYQHEESIEGQLRECKTFNEKNGIQIVEIYIDRSLSAKTDRRPNFQRMIKDSSGK